MSEWMQHIHDEKTDEWGTPPCIWRPLAKAVGGFDLDPCSGAETSPIASERFDESDDGISEPWFGTVWLNPPYSDMPPWMKESVAETNSDRADTVVALIPARTSTEWWHDHVGQASAVCFVEGRIHFQGRGNGDRRAGSDSPSFASAIAVFGDCPPELFDALDQLGMVFDGTAQYERTQQLTFDHEETTDTEVKSK